MWMNRCIILFPLVTISLYSRKVIFAFDNCSYNLFSQECFEFQYLEFLLCHFQIPALDKFLFDVKDLKSNLSHAELVPAKQSLIVCIHNYTFFFILLMTNICIQCHISTFLFRWPEKRVMVYLIFIAAISIRTWSQLCFGGRVQIRSINMRMTEPSTLAQGWSAVPELEWIPLVIHQPIVFHFNRESHDGWCRWHRKWLQTSHLEVLFILGY